MIYLVKTKKTMHLLAVMILRTKGHGQLLIQIKERKVQRRENVIKKVCEGRYTCQILGNGLWQAANLAIRGQTTSCKIDREHIRGEKQQKARNRTSTYSLPSMGEDIQVYISFFIKTSFFFNFFKTIL